MTRPANASARLRIAFRSKRELNAILDSLRPELQHPAGEKARARMTAHGKLLILCFEADNSAALRAIFSSYLRLVAASLRVCDNLIKLERSSEMARQKG